MENTEKKTYSIEEIRQSADWISSACPKQADMLRQFAEMLAKPNKRYIVTIVDCDYCETCEVFATQEAALEFVKGEFKKHGRDWGKRFSMVDSAGGFPLREYEGGEREYDIHEKEIA